LHDAAQAGLVIPRAAATFAREENLQRPPNGNSLAHSRLTPQRAASITFVAAIHVVAIYGLIAALVPGTRIPLSSGPIEVINTPEKKTNADLPPRLDFLRPAGPTVERPVVDVDNTSHQGPPRTTGPTDSYTTVHTDSDVAPRAIASTHTTPPYPATSLRLGEQGTVRLLLMISADGDVISATVEETSGSYALDQTAIDWVRRHWRYHPGVHGGAAAAMTTEADIRFDIRHAR
jgi:TonB family protein